MDELVAQVAARTGIDPATARKAVVVMLRFLLREGKSDKVGGLVDALPGAREAIGTGQGASGLMGVFGELTAAGLGMTQVQGVARAFMAVAKEKAGEAEVDQIITSVPGLRQFV
jgi:hypothetical protein